MHVPKCVKAIELLCNLKENHLCHHCRLCLRSCPHEILYKVEGSFSGGKHPLELHIFVSMVDNDMLHVKLSDMRRVVGLS